MGLGCRQRDFWSGHLKLVETLGQPLRQARLPCPVKRGILTLHHVATADVEASRCPATKPVFTNGWIHDADANNARNYGGSHGLDVTATREQSPCRREHTYFAGHMCWWNRRSEDWELRTRSWPSTRPPLGPIGSSLLTVFSLAAHTFPCSICLRSALAAGCPCCPGDGATGGGRSNPLDLVKAFLFFPV